MYTPPMATRQRPNGSTSSTSSKTTATSTPDHDAKAPPNPKSSSKTSTKSKDEAIKARIMKHMNAEHRESLGLYLRFYSGLDANDAEEPKLVDMSYSSLTIEAHNGGKLYTVPVEPRMESWSDVRPRVVAMDREARAGLGLPPLPGSDDNDNEHTGEHYVEQSSSAKSTITRYNPPTAPFHLFTIALVVWFYTGYFLLKNNTLIPGHWYWDNVMTWFPVGGAEGYKWLNLTLGWPVLGVHGAEAVWMGWRLRGYGVRSDKGVWWKWVGSTLLEGWGAHQRLGDVVRRGKGRLTEG